MATAEHRAAAHSPRDLVPAGEWRLHRGEGERSPTRLAYDAARSAFVLRVLREEKLREERAEADEAEANKARAERPQKRGGAAVAAEALTAKAEAGTGAGAGAGARSAEAEAEAAVEEEAVEEAAVEEAVAVLLVKAAEEAELSRKQ